MLNNGKNNKELFKLIVGGSYIISYKGLKNRCIINAINEYDDCTSIEYSISTNEQVKNNFLIKLTEEVTIEKVDYEVDSEIDSNIMNQFYVGEDERLISEFEEHSKLNNMIRFLEKIDENNLFTILLRDGSKYRGVIDRIQALYKGNKSYLILSNIDKEDKKIIIQDIEDIKEYYSNEKITKIFDEDEKQINNEDKVSELNIIHRFLEKINNKSLFSIKLKNKQSIEGIIVKMGFIIYDKMYLKIQIKNSTIKQRIYVEDIENIHEIFSDEENRQYYEESDDKENDKYVDDNVSTSLNGIKIYSNLDTISKYVFTLIKEGKKSIIVGYIKSINISEMDSQFITINVTLKDDTTDQKIIYLDDLLTITRYNHVKHNSYEKFMEENY
jgi:hypothetical protein